MSVYIIFDSLGAAQVTGRGKNILDVFKNNLNTRELSLIKQTWVKLNNITRQIPYFNLKVFSKSVSNIPKLENLIVRTTKDKLLKENLPKVFSLIDKLVRPKFKGNKYLDPILFKKHFKHALLKTQTLSLLDQFRKFLGDYADKETLKIQVAIVWQPNYASSSAIKPNLIILGISKDFNIYSILRVLFHESLHLQYDPFLGKLRFKLVGKKPKITQKQTNFLTTFNEALAYLWHYDYFETECLKNKSRLEKGLREKNRWNPHHLAFALKMKPLVDEYRITHKEIDQDHFTIK